jgi:hypothetical protein
MSNRIYHQLGFNPNWNLDSIYNDGIGERCILAPRFMEKEKIERYAKPFRAQCIFDPQFFKPEIAKQKLATYEFFPDILADGFKTDDFQEKWSATAAEKCVAWQVAQDFEFITIPGRYLDGGGAGFIAKQEGLFVSPFLAEIKRQGRQRRVLLQLVLTSYMLLDETFRTDILNWVTGRQGIHGVYLILEVEKRGKQLKDIKLLGSLLSLVDAFRANEMEVVCGYTNTEAILLALADANGVTLGSYENTRMFNIRNFEETDKPQGAPNPRIYCSKLLNWINSDYVDTIKRVLPEGDDFFDKTSYRADMFVPTFQWHFNKPEIYKHYFKVFGSQLSEAFNLPARERYEYVISSMKRARVEHQRLEDAGIFLDPDSAPSYLGQWLTVATQFGKSKGWA